MKLIELHNVSVAYDAEPVLKGVNLTISEGDFVGVIGPNGGGKTTLVKAMLGQVAYSGRIDYAPEVMRDGVPAIGYLPQQNLFDRAFPISVREVVLSGLQSQKRWGVGYGRGDHERVAETLRMMDLEALADRPIGEISGGQMQRVAIARGLLRNRSVIILDEPTAALDPETERVLLQRLAQYARSRTMIIITHREATAELCDGVVNIE